MEWSSITGGGGLQNIGGGEGASEVLPLHTNKTKRGWRGGSHPEGGGGVTKSYVVVLTRVLEVLTYWRVCVWGGGWCTTTIYPLLTLPHLPRINGQSLRLISNKGHIEKLIIDSTV